MSSSNTTNNADFFYSKDNLQDTNFSTGITKLSIFYRVKDYKTKVLIVIITGIVFAIALAFLVENSGLYSGGTAALMQGIARFFHCVIDENTHLTSNVSNVIYNILFWGLYLVFNAILYLFLRNKMSRKFLDLSLIFIATSQLAGMAFSMIPGISNLLIFGDTTTIDTNLSDLRIQVLIFDPNIWPTVDTSGSYDWGHRIIDASLVSDTLKSEILSANIDRSFLLLIYAVVFAIIQAFANSILYVLGASSFGTEALALYISESKNKDISGVIRILQLSMIAVGVIFGSYLVSIVAFPHYAKYYASWTYLFSANLICSFVCTILYSLFVKFLFPSRKLTKAEIITSKMGYVLKSLDESHYAHPTTLLESRGGYSKNKSNIIITVLPVMEIPTFVKTVRKVDEQCIISFSDLADFDGKISLKKHQINSKRKQELQSLRNKINKDRVELHKINRTIEREKSVVKKELQKQLKQLKWNLVFKKINYSSYSKEKSLIKQNAYLKIKNIDIKYASEISNLTTNIKDESIKLKKL